MKDKKPTVKKPTKEITIAFALEKDLYEKIKDDAKEDLRTVSFVVWKIVRDFYDKD